MSEARPNQIARLSKSKLTTVDQCLKKLLRGSGRLCLGRGLGITRRLENVRVFGRFDCGVDQRILNRINGCAGFTIFRR